MVRQVEVRWSAPSMWDSRTNKLYGATPPGGAGIYQLTRVWAGYESLLYIGIVWSEERSMIQRMKEHRGEWIDTLRGINYRFGTVTPLRGLVCDRYLLESIEGALILELQPPENSKKKKSYTLTGDEMVIRNRRNRGPLPRFVDTTTHA